MRNTVVYSKNALHRVSVEALQDAGLSSATSLLLWENGDVTFLNGVEVNYAAASMAREEAGFEFGSPSTTPVEDRGLNDKIFNQ